MSGNPDLPSLGARFVVPVKHVACCRQAFLMYEHAKSGASPGHVRAPAAGAVVLDRSDNTCGQERALRAVCFILGCECLNHHLVCVRRRIKYVARRRHVFLAHKHQCWRIPPAVSAWIIASMPEDSTMPRAMSVSARVPND